MQLPNVPSGCAGAPFQLHSDVEDEITGVTVVYNGSPIPFADDVFGFHCCSTFIMVEEWDLE